MERGMTMNLKTGREFMEKTKYQYLGQSDQQKELPQPPLTQGAEGKPTIDLPRPESISVKQIDLTAAINERKSLRKYADQALTMAELSYLLWCTQGVKRVTSRPATLRTVPSAGSRHPFETYILVNRVEGLQPGVYRFVSEEHKLVVVDLNPELADKITHAAYNQPMVKHSAVTFIWVAVAYRSIWRYQERAYRYMHLDAGHVCQNLYLSAEAVDSGVCAIAAFDDDEINGLLGLDGLEQFVIYLATLGKK
jgi:SagB-type dehydrogenase family enzyme